MKYDPELEELEEHEEESKLFDVGDEIFDDSESKRSMQNVHEAEFIYDEVKGSHGKKTVLSKLNQRILGKHEMDDIFADWA